MMNPHEKDEYWENVVGIKGGCGHSSTDVAESGLIAGWCFIMLLTIFVVAVVGSLISQI